MGIKEQYKNDDNINKILAEAWLNVDKKDSELFNPIATIPDEFMDAPEDYLTYVMIQPQYLSFICKHVLNVEVTPQQALILAEMWNRRFPMLVASRGFGKSFIAGIYVLLRLLLLPRRKVVVAGAGFRQSKFIFEYSKGIYDNAPLLRDIVAKSNGKAGGPKSDVDVCKIKIGDSNAFFIPIGTGEKIRGYRANDLMADEFSSINRDIFEVVLSGFLAVRSNPIQEMKDIASKKKAIELGVWEDDPIDSDINKSNQLIISGTASYAFENFGLYWKKWRDIIRSNGEYERLKNIFVNSDGEVDIPEDFDHRDYSIVRIPFELIQKGLMDEAQIARAKATMHVGLYQMEYGAVFAKDSMGFFKRSLITSCTPTSTNPIMTANGPIVFEPKLVGEHNRQYVIGVDPASETDNLAIYVLEIHPDHRRIVYGWTTNRKQHIAEKKAGLTNEHDYYSYCARKIRELIKRFNTLRVAIDKQGGGVAIMEALHDPDKYDAENGEVPIWEVIDEDKEKETDFYQGLHIVELIQFAQADWTYEANHGLRKDMEDKILLFPQDDAVSRVEARERDKMAGRIFQQGEEIISYDTMEDCIDQINELKDELSIIVHTKTGSGRDKWDTPEIKEGIGKKGRLRKDRYSALLMANMVARQQYRELPQLERTMYGDFAHILNASKKEESGPLIDGPAWYMEEMSDDIYDQ